MTAYQTPLDLDYFRETIAGYSAELLEKTVQRAGRYSQAKETDPAKKLERILSGKRSCARLIAELEEDERLALAMFARLPSVRWRWDHALRLLQASGVVSPYRTVQSLLNQGLLCMRPQRSGQPLARFEVADGSPIEALPILAFPAAIKASQAELPDVVEPIEATDAGDRWRQCDGWEFPLRLAVLWRLASLAPIKRTQQNKLFKRDQERILRNPLLTSPLLDSPETIEDPGAFIYHLAIAQGWLASGVDEQEPAGSLGEIWPTELVDLLTKCAGDVVLLEDWNELGSEAPVGSFSREVATGRVLLLLLLGSLPDGAGATLEQLASRLEQIHPLWNGEGELIGPLRYPESRAELARRWTRVCLCGPLYQCALVRIDASESTPLYSLTALGRRFLGEDVEVPPFPSYPQTLLAQPNFELIVYRQGLTIPLLGELVQFAEPKSLGAALTFEVNADSVYHGLETGIAADRIVQTLKEHGGRELPPALEDAIKTWSQKRDQLILYASCSLLEFATAQDLQEALDRGMKGDRVSDTFLLVSGEAERDLKQLRITASRDYRFPTQQCVTTDDDGVTLHVDASKSDLMLDAELRRIAEPHGMEHSDQAFVITAASLTAASEQGLGLDYLDRWFRNRTGNPPPSSVLLLLRAVDGTQLVARHRLVIRTESHIVADGLLQHPETKEFFDERLGPDTLAVGQDNVPPLREALARLGIDFMIES